MFSFFRSNAVPQKLLLEKELPSISPSGSLLSILNDQIGVYLLNDTKWWSEEGKRRAESYQESLRKLGTKKDMSEMSVLEKVISDIKDKEQGVLGTSVDLRARLMDGLCSYLKIDQGAIEHNILAASPVTPTLGEVQVLKVKFTVEAIEDAVKKRKLSLKNTIGKDNLYTEENRPKI